MKLKFLKIRNFLSRLLRIKNVTVKDVYLELYRFHDSKLAEEITETANEMMDEMRKHLIDEK